MNQKATRNLEFCVVTRVALRYTPPTFLVEYKISSNDEVHAADIYHIEIVIDGLTSASDPSGIAQILIDNCSILRQSASSSTGLKFSQIAQLCQKLVDRQKHGMNKPSNYFATSIQEETNCGQMTQLPSNYTYVIKEGEKQEPQIYENSPPIPCIFLPQHLSIASQNNRENSNTANLSSEVEIVKGQGVLVPSSVSNVMMKFTAQQDVEDVQERKGSITSSRVENPQERPSKMPAQEDNAETSENSVSKRSARSSTNGRLSNSLQHPNQSNLPNDGFEMTLNNLYGDCNEGNASRAKALSSQYLPVERQLEAEYYNDNKFEKQEPSLPTSNITIKKQHSNTTRVHCCDYSNYSEAFEEETTTTLHTHNNSSPGDNRKGIIGASAQLMMPREQMPAKSPQKIPFLGQQLWAEDKTKPPNRETADVTSFFEESNSEQQFTEYTINTELETHFEK